MTHSLRWLLRSSYKSWWQLEKSAYRIHIWRINSLCPTTHFLILPSRNQYIVKIVTALVTGLWLYFCLLCTSGLVRSLMLALAVYHRWSFTLLKSCVYTWSHIFICLSLFIFLMFLAFIIPENKGSPVKTQNAEGTRKSKNSVIFLSLGI